MNIVRFAKKPAGFALRNAACTLMNTARNARELAEDARQHVTSIIRTLFCVDSTVEFIYAEGEVYG
jgi:hypothetical protein